MDEKSEESRYLKKVLQDEKNREKEELRVEWGGRGKQFLPGENIEFKLNQIEAFFFFLTNAIWNSIVGFCFQMALEFEPSCLHLFWQKNVLCDKHERKHTGKKTKRLNCINLFNFHAFISNYMNIKILQAFMLALSTPPQQNHPHQYIY